MFRTAKSAGSVAAIVVLGSTLFVFAQDEDGGFHGGPPWAQPGCLSGGPPWMRAAKAFAQFDEDGDGMLTEDEAPAYAWRFLSVADLDDDGSVTTSEVAASVAVRVFDILDANEDGSLSEDEVPGPAWTHLAGADADETGSVSETEFATAVEARLAEPALVQDGESPAGPPCMHGGGVAVGPPWMRAAQAFVRFDADGDGALTEEEVPQHAWDFLSSADSDGDGSVAMSEVAETIATRVFGFFDANQDGALSEDEVPGPAWAHLSTADANGDGFVFETEFATATETRFAGLQDGSIGMKDATSIRRFPGMREGTHPSGANGGTPRRKGESTLERR